MKKTSLSLGYLVLALALFSCGKPKTNPTPSSLWILGSSSFKGTASTDTKGNNVHADATDGVNGFYIYFANLPTKSGTYNIVSYNTTSVSSTLGPNDCAIEINTSATDVYLSTGYDKATIQVNVNNGKINVFTINSQFWVRHFNSSGVQSDSLQSDCGIYEY